MRHLFRRQLYLIDHALSSLARKKGKNLSLLLLYTLVLFLLASLLFFVSALRREARAILSDSPDLIVQSQIAGRHDPIPLSVAESIRKIRGVGNVTPRLWGYYYDPLFKVNLTVVADPEKSISRGEVVLGEGASRILRVKEGDMVTLRSYRNETMLMTVASLTPHESELVSSDLLVVNPEDFKDLFDFPSGVATDLAVTVRNPREHATIAAKIAELDPKLRPILRSEILRTYDSLFDWRSGIVAIVLLVAVLSFVIFAWDKATGLSADERQEIGILKAIGWDTTEILILKGWEGGVISTLAFLAGTLLAYIHVFFLRAPLFGSVLKGWSVLYPDFRLSPSLSTIELTSLFLLTVLPYVLATLFPTWLAATTDPDSVMRS